MLISLSVRDVNASTPPCSFDMRAVERVTCMPRCMPRHVYATLEAALVGKTQLMTEILLEMIEILLEIRYLFKNATIINILGTWGRIYYST